MISSDLRKAFSKENLNRSLFWLRSNKDGAYKNYFRNIYRSYTLAEEPLLEDLRKRLLHNTFEPTFATKVYLNKKSGILRSISLLAIEDQIVYQAMVGHIAEKIYRKKAVKQNIKKKTFGNIFAGNSAFKFYDDWQNGYADFCEMFEVSFNKGLVYTASFDLTACFDSISHEVLRHFLLRYGLDDEFCNFLIKLLEKWTGFERIPRPVFHGHGIPQGPLSSGLLSEIILMQFDDALDDIKRVRYFRYVDDIRLLAKDEIQLRKCLVKLDIRSKYLGLFPQSGKIDIHKILNIDDEIKSGIFVSTGDVEPDIFPLAERTEYYSEIKELTKGLIILNESRFKYLLTKVKPLNGLQTRLISLLEKNPHLFRPILSCYSKLPSFSLKISENIFKLYKDQDLYLSYKSQLGELLRDRIHDTLLKDFIRYSKKVVKTESYKKDPELRSIINSILIKHANLSFSDLQQIILGERNWWARQRQVSFINKAKIGIPSYESLLKELLKSTSVDSSLVSAERFLMNDLKLNSRSKSNHAAQIILKEHGVINRVTKTRCIISESYCRILKLNRDVRWKPILDKHYDAIDSKILRWESYYKSDPTAWINLSDTINDILVDRVFKTDMTIGTAPGIGKIGSGLAKTSRFALKYPLYFKATLLLHETRLRSDLSHPKTKATGKYTSYISYEDSREIGRLLKIGIEEVWSKHFSIIR